jgi:hypothetical protein
MILVFAKFEEIAKKRKRELFFLRMAIWLRGLKRWYLVLGSVG